MLDAGWQYLLAEAVALLYVHCCLDAHGLRVQGVVGGLGRVALAEHLLPPSLIHLGQNVRVQGQHKVTLPAPEALLVQLDAHIHLLRGIDLGVAADTGGVTAGLLDGREVLLVVGVSVTIVTPI